MDAAQRAARRRRRPPAPAITLLTLPPDALAEVAARLGPQPLDRLHLTACCRTLLAASRHDSGGSWWRELAVELHTKRGAAGFQAWLAKWRPLVAVLAANIDYWASQAFQLPSPPLPTLLELQLGNLCIESSILQYTQLERLELDSLPFNELPRQLSALSRLHTLSIFDHPLPGGMHHLLPMGLTSLDYGRVDAGRAGGPLLAELSRLSGLRQLSLSFDREIPTEGWQGRLQHLTRLETLQLYGLFDALPGTLTALTALQALEAYHDFELSTGWFHLEEAADLGQRLTRLEVSCCGVIELPPALSALTALKRLSVVPNDSEDGEVGEGFEIVGGLEHLHRLPLTHLALGSCTTDLPPAIGTLSALQHFSVELGYGCWDIQAVSRLSNLTQLRLRAVAGPGMSLPCIASTGLKSLALEDLCCLRRLSPLGQRLTQLKLRQCPGHAWPGAISRLAALQELDVEECNWLFGGWQHLSTLRHLTMLVLTGCDSSNPAVAPSPPSPPLLHRLVVQQCSYPDAQLPPSLASQPHLTHLELHADKGQQALAAHGIASFPVLRSLSLEGAIDLLADPQHAPHLPQLTTLCLKLHCGQGPRWQHADIPAALASCSALRELTVCFADVEGRTRADTAAHIAAGWQHLASLQQLTSLSVTSCNLRKLPASLSAITALRCLDLSYNRELDGGWKHLENLTKLTYLGLKGVDGRRLPHFLIARLGLRLDLARGWDWEEG